MREADKEKHPELPAIVLYSSISVGNLTPLLDVACFICHETGGKLSVVTRLVETVPLSDTEGH